MSTEREAGAGAAQDANAVTTFGITEPASNQRGVFGVPAIVVVNFGSHELIRQNLGDIPWVDDGFRVVVVDNFSTPVERHGVRELVASRGWDLVEVAGNCGFGAAVNLGIEAASTLGSTIFLLINPDARIDLAAAKGLSDESRHNPLALVTPKIIASDGSVFFDGALLDMDDGRVRGRKSVSRLTITQNYGSGIVNGRVHAVVPWLTGACVTLSRELYDRIGGMDDRFFLYWEDIDLSYRARQAGAELTIRRDLTVIHDEGGTQGERRGRAKSNLYYYYNCRNRLLFAALHLSRRQITKWVISSPSASWAILLQGGRLQLVQSPGPLLSAVSGTLVGLVIALRAVIGPRAPRNSALQDGAVRDHATIRNCS